MDPKWNFISLAMMLTTLQASIQFLQRFNILPQSLKCAKCTSEMTKLQTFKSQPNLANFACEKCGATRSVKSNTILYKAQLSYRSFLLLTYIVAIMSNLTYDNSKYTKYYPTQSKSGPFMVHSPFNSIPFQIQNIVSVQSELRVPVFNEGEPVFEAEPMLAHSTINVCVSSILNSE